MPHLRSIGVGNEGGEVGEYAAILYDSNRIEVLEQGTFWFSATPSIPGSRSWGAFTPRICTWGRFRDLNTGATFYSFNVHWDHLSPVSRLFSAMLLRSRVSERSNKSDPVVLSGDFNAPEWEPSFLLLQYGSDFIDSYRWLYPTEKESGTFHNFSGQRDGKKIDALLVSAGLKILSSEIDHTQIGGRYPSDHFPVVTKLQYQNGSVFYP